MRAALTASPKLDRCAGRLPTAAFQPLIIEKFRRLGAEFVALLERRIPWML
jgi:hypothetical protein